MPSIKEYTISVPDSKLVQLRAKLENTDFLSDLDEARWQYGSPLPDITLPRLFQDAAEISLSLD
jgi:hypothetical protein